MFFYTFYHKNVILSIQNKMLGGIFLKFSVGYQLFGDSDFLDSIIKYKKDIYEVYFSFGDFPNGRNSQLNQKGMLPWEAQSKQTEDLKRLSLENIALNLLFNATCYGKDSLSRAFFEKVGDAVDFIKTAFGLKSVTTTSPVIAAFIKNNFEGIDVRASVNMCIGSIEGMEYVKDSFDSFYLKRELNRDFSEIKKLKAWCDSNGKTLYALANSGCLNNCSAHTFHDNLVSHEGEISAMDNGFVFEGVCRKYLKNRDNLSKILEYTSFIRPEDVYLYEGLFPALKLATRVNEKPAKILEAYIEKKRFTGSALALLEPNHTGAIYPYFLENSDIKATLREDKLIYENIDDALIKLEEDIYVKA